MKIFDELVQEILRDRWQFSPVTATFDGIHDYDDKLDRFSASIVRDEVAKRRGFLMALEAIPLNSLDFSRRVDAQVLAGALADSILELDEIRAWQRDPSAYLQMGLYGIYVLMTRDFAPQEVRANSALARAEAFPRLLEDAKSNIEKAAHVFCETARQVATAARGFFEESFLQFASSADPGRARAACENAVASIDAYIAHLDTVWLPKADDGFAIGRKAFNQKLRLAHGLQYDAEQLLQIGEQARRDTVASLIELAAQIEPGTDWPDLVRRLRKSHPAANELLGAYATEMKRARRFVTEHALVSLPEDESLEIVETPQFDRPTTPYAALLPPAPFESRQQSFFYVTPPEPGAGEEASLEEHSLYSIPVTALHEAYPGHHLQLVRANRGSSPVRKVYSTPVMVEGWALYCEEMMYEAGFYPDAATRLFQLKDLLWRACRVILDVRLHTGDMTVDAAVRYLVEEAHLNPAEARAEVRRYCAMPTYPMSYLIGRGEFYRLRHEVQMRRQGRFSLREFHDALLSWGGIPVNLIREGVLNDPAFSAAA